MTADMDAFMAAVAGLSPMQHRAMALRMYAGMSEAEIANALGITQNTVKVHTFRARQKLATAIGRDPRVIPADLGTRFLRHVRKTDSCWLWTAWTDPDGYGYFRDGPRKVGAHRWAYARWVEAIPAHLEIDHLCRVRNCVNPEHLEAVTRRENTLRSESFTAVNARKTHCPRGHAYTPENTYIYRRSRHCRACNRQAQARAKRTEHVA